MLHWSPDVEGHAIIARKLLFDSASVRVEMENASAPSIQSEPANMESTAFRTSESAALRVPFGGGAAGLSDREPWPELSEGRTSSMYDWIATYIEEVRTLLRIDVSDAVYTRCMEELRSLREGRFDRVSQCLDNLRALVEKLQSRLVLVEDSRLDSFDTFGEGRPERPASAGRSDARPFTSADQMRAFAHIPAQLNSTSRRVRQMERTPTATSPVTPPIGPGGTVPLNAYGAQELEPSGADTSRPARGDRTRIDATFASETQALLPVAGERRGASRVPYGNETGREEAARGPREPILSFDPRWGGYQPQDLTTRQGPVDVRSLPVIPFGTLGSAAPGLRQSTR